MNAISQALIRISSVSSPRCSFLIMKCRRRAESRRESTTTAATGRMGLSRCSRDVLVPSAELSQSGTGELWATSTVWQEMMSESAQWWAAELTSDDPSGRNRRPWPQSDPTSCLLCRRELFIDSGYKQSWFTQTPNCLIWEELQQSSTIEPLLNHLYPSFEERRGHVGLELYAAPLAGYTALWNERASPKCFPSFCPFDSTAAEISPAGAAWWLWLWRVIDWRGLSPSKSPAHGAENDRGEAVCNQRAFATYTAWCWVSPARMTVAESTLKYFIFCLIFQILLKWLYLAGSNLTKNYFLCPFIKAFLSKMIQLFSAEEITCFSILMTVK